MKLGLITQIRNEIDIIHTFLQHVDALFDVVYLLDHNSIDGTQDVLQQAVSQRPGWKYYLLNFKGSFQEHVSNFFLRQAFTENVDTLFFLDADEFLRFPDRETLETKLSDLNTNQKVGHLKWIGGTPENFSHDALLKSSRLLISHGHSFFKKVVIPKSCFINDENMHIALGNHAVFSSTAEEFPYIELGDLVHIPIRSKQQAIRKALITSIAHSLNANRPFGSGYQFRVFLNEIAYGQLDDRALRRFTHIYENPEFINANDNEIERYWQDADHTSLAELEIAFSDELDLSETETTNDLQAMIADALLSTSPINPNNFDLAIEGNAINLVEKDTFAIISDEQELIKGQLTEEKKQKLDMDLTNVRNAINELENSNQILEVELSKQTLQVEQLEKKLIELEQEVLFYSQSKSWKITRPLRMIFKLFKWK